MLGRSPRLFKPSLRVTNALTRLMGGPQIARIGGCFALLATLCGGCSRQAAPAAPAAPEVLVTTVQPRDVPRVLERVATLDGYINANINAEVQGYIISRDYQEGSVVKKGEIGRAHV